MKEDDHAAQSERMGGVDNFGLAKAAWQASAEQEIALGRDMIRDFVRAFKRISRDFPDRSIESRIGSFASWLNTRLGIEYDAAALLAMAVEMLSRMPEEEL